MVTIVVIGNFLIGLICLFVAWRLWKLAHQMANIANTLISVEQVVHSTLDGAPHFIMHGQTGINQLRQRYGVLKPQVQRARQAWALLSLGQTLWRRRSVLSLRSKSTRKASGRRL